MNLRYFRLLHRPPHARADKTWCHPGDSGAATPMLVKIMNQASWIISQFPVHSERTVSVMVMIGEDVGPTPTVFFIGLIVYSFDYLEGKKTDFSPPHESHPGK